MLSHVVCWVIFLVMYVPCILILVSFSNMWGAQVYDDLDY
jgi:ABC-type spermidine/putrescine transport system permease subunit II